MYGCTGVQVPPPFIHFIPMLWGVLEWMCPTPRTYALPFSPILPTTGNYWNPPGTYTTLGFSCICPNPTTYALPFPYCWKLGTTWKLYDPRILLGALPPSAAPPPFIHFIPMLWVCWHAFPFPLQLDTIGTAWNHLETTLP